ncbi:phosphoglycerate mutase-like protein [Aureobasidium subglaciale]|nr:phosphoglycerate mutase-like protein [Aureobasidium subglaciale]KAI5231017.1 phosphoglycerate mutase-like protein [Aureobasidium subglaciale]KAI5265150.1 phosphoglycerate mutase-like protein [Aureobasidium subglaciale]
MTTLIPRESYTPDELSRLYPKELALQQVQVLLRHGSAAFSFRATTSSDNHVKAKDPPSLRDSRMSQDWPYCNAAQQLRSVIMSANNSWDELAYRRRLETFDENDDSPVLSLGPRRETDGICLPGELTDQGRASTLALGQRLRRLYVDQLGFMPTVLQDANHMYLRATPIPRALESVQQTFYGLYPPSSRAADFAPPTIVQRQPSHETLFPNEGACRRFAQLSQAFAQRTADRWNETEDMAHLNKLFGKWMPQDSSTVKVDGHPRLSGIMDTVNSTLAHPQETRLPKEFYDMKGRAIIDKIGVEEWFSGYMESTEYRQLGIGGLMGDVVSRLVEKTRAPASSNSDVQMALSGCHDTTLAAVLSSMGAFTGEQWPPYTSHIAIELFKDRTVPTTAQPAITTGRSSSRTPLTMLSDSDKQKLDGYYVRMRYNDRAMKVPGCRPAGKHYGDDESLCTLEAFKGIVDKFTPKNWKQACGSRLGENAFPDTIEPAGI